jgi:hypothetical protein
VRAAAGVDAQQQQIERVRRVRDGVAVQEQRKRLRAEKLLTEQLCAPSARTDAATVRRSDLELGP